MKKLLLFLTFCLAFSFFAQAQISEGQPRTSIIRTGNRPVKGDFGFYIGPSYTEIRDLISWADKNSDVDVVRGLPLFNVKYYVSNNWEFKCGIQWYGKTTSFKGTQMIGDLTQDAKGSNSITRFRLNPGMAYHFNTKNILDVYIGVEVPLGFDIEKVIQASGEFLVKSTKNSPVIGLGAFGGLQVFVADLPFAIGVEFGLTGLTKLGQKVKHKVTSEDYTQIFYTRLNGTDEILDIYYSKLNASTFESGADLRLTFSYYFNNKK